MNSNYKTLLKDTLIFGIGSLGSKVILFLLVPIYTNFLSTAEYGTADLVTTFASLLVPFTALSINSAVIRFGMKTGVAKENVIKDSMLVLLISVLVTLLLYPLTGLYHAIAEWRIYLLSIVFLTNFSEIGKNYLKVKNKNKLYSIFGIGQTLILALTNIVTLTILKTGVNGYLLANITSLAFSSVACFFAAGIHKDIAIGKVDVSLFKEMLKYSSPLVFSGISWLVLHSSDKIMIEWMIGASVLGIYTAATKIPSLINVIIGVFNQAWGISTIREAETSNNQSFYSSVFDKFVCFLYGAAILFIAICKPFMSIYVGANFFESWQYTPFLMVAAVFASIFAFIGSLYAAKQKTFNDMWTSVLCAVLNVIINYFGIKTIGIWGAVIGTVSSYFVFSIIRVIDIRKIISFKVDINRLVLGTVLLFVEAYCVTQGIFAIIVSLVCCLAYVIVYFKHIKSTFKLIVHRKQ